MEILLKILFLPVLPLISTYEPLSSSSNFEETFEISTNCVFDRLIKWSAILRSRGDSLSNLSSDKNSHISTRK